MIHWANLVRNMRARNLVCSFGVPAHLQTRAPVLSPPVHITCMPFWGPHTAAGVAPASLPRWPIPGHSPCPSDGPAGEHPTSPLDRLAAFPNPGMCHVQDRHLEKRRRQENRKLEISSKTRNFVEISTKFHRKERPWGIYARACLGCVWAVWGRRAF